MANIKTIYREEFDVMVYSDLSDNQLMKRYHEYTKWTEIDKTFNFNPYSDILGEMETTEFIDKKLQYSELCEVIKLWDIRWAVNTELLSYKYISWSISKNDIYRIIYLQALRNAIHSIVEADYLSEYYLQLLFVIESDLSLAWWFSNEKKDMDWWYFKFWNIPKIYQPHIDNEDNYPSGHYSITENDVFSMKKYQDFSKFANTHSIDSDFLRSL